MEVCKINTIVDGHDVIKVLLWEKPGEEKGNLVTSLLKDTPVSIIGRFAAADGKDIEYLQLSVTNDGGETFTGWCLKDFVNESNS